MFSRTKGTLSTSILHVCLHSCLSVWGGEATKINTPASVQSSGPCLQASALIYWTGWRMAEVFPIQLSASWGVS